MAPIRKKKQLQVKKIKINKRNLRLKTELLITKFCDSPDSLECTLRYQLPSNEEERIKKLQYNFYYHPTGSHCLTCCCNVLLVDPNKGQVTQDQLSSQQNRITKNPLQTKLCYLSSNLHPNEDYPKEKKRKIVETNFPQVSLNALPTEVFRLILSKLEGKSLVISSRVCLHWYKVIHHIGKVAWREVCETEIVPRDLQQILFKTSSNFKQIYKAWFISTYSPDQWTYDKERVLDGRLVVKCMKIYKDRLIILNNYETFYLYSLETFELLARSRTEQFIKQTLASYFTIIELENEAYLIIRKKQQENLPSPVLWILKIGDKSFENYHTFNYKQLVANSIVHYHSSKSHVALIVPGSYDITLLKAEKDIIKAHSITFQLATTLTYNRQFPITTWCENFTFWGDQFVACSAGHIYLHSIKGGLETTSFAIPADKSMGFQFVSTGRSLRVFGKKAFYEIQKRDAEYHVVMQMSIASAFYYTYFSRFFSNMCIFWNSSKQLVFFDITAVSQFNSIIETTKVKYPVRYFEVSFYKDDLIIVYASGRQIVVKNYNVKKNHNYPNSLYQMNGALM